MRSGSRATGDSWLKRATAHAFYRLLNRVSERPIPMDTGDFACSAAARWSALKLVREHHRFMKGLYSWVGFSEIAVPYHRAPRRAADHKWNYWKLWNFSLEGITSFSTLPLRLTSYVGFAAALLAVFYGVLYCFGRCCSAIRSPVTRLCSSSSCFSAARSS